MESIGSGERDVSPAVFPLPHDGDTSTARDDLEQPEDDISDISAEDSNHSSLSEGILNGGGIDSNENSEVEQRMDANDSDDSVESDDVSREELEECSKLYTGSKFTLDEAVLDIVGDFHNNDMTKECLKVQLKTFVKHLPPDNIMPNSVHRIFKHVENQAPTYVESAHPYCRQCLSYLPIEGSCELCSNCDVKYFYSFSLEEQVRYYFEHRNQADMIDAYNRERQRASLTESLYEIFVMDQNTNGSKLMALRTKLPLFPTLMV